MAYEYPLGIGGDGVNDESPYRSRILFQAKKVQRISFQQRIKTNIWDDGLARLEQLQNTSLTDLLPSGTREVPESREDRQRKEQERRAFESRGKASALYETKPELNSSPIIGESVALYTPIAIQLDDRLEYNNSAALGISGTAAFNALNNTNSIAGAVDATLGATSAGISDFIGAIGGSGLSDLAMIRASQGILGRNIVSEKLQNAVSLAAQITVNPNLRTLFKGVTIRGFNFQFQFIPTSAPEAAMIERIVEFFRYYAYPSIDKLGAFGYRFPERFAINVQHCDVNGEWSNIKPKILDSYLTNVSVTYNPTASVYFDDGRPTQTNVALTFAEYRALNKTDVDYRKSNDGAYNSEEEAAVTDLVNDRFGNDDQLEV